MRTWRWGLAGLLVVGLSASSAFADGNPRVGNNLPGGAASFETTLCGHTQGSEGGNSIKDVPCVNILGSGLRVYGFSVTATVAAGECALYDKTTLPTSSGDGHTQGTFIDEIQVDTDERQEFSIWPAPYLLVNGLSVGCEDAFAIIYHEPK